MKRIIVNFSEKQEAHQFPEGIRYRIPLKCGTAVCNTDRLFLRGQSRSV